MTHRIRALIAEDEPLAREKLAELLEREPDIDLVAACRDGGEALEAIATQNPELVILDVQMPVLSGMQVVEAVGAEQMPLTIFLTAFDAFAVKAFEVNAVDYLLKPLDPARLAAALERARARLATPDRSALGTEIQRMLRSFAGTADYPARIPVKLADRYEFVRTDEIEWVEAADNYVALHVGGRKFLVRETVSGFEQKLDPERFVRVRASAIVNLDRVAAVRPWSGSEYEIQLRDGTKLLSTRMFRERVRSLIRS
ncbi:MAG TPA: LytTR family DNA-binding domain-containing protein [Longimicrobium sp.]|nr:LytTR family DNA-binding domain-containing protein [Longimicrobium sp.]